MSKRFAEYVTVLGISIALLALPDLAAAQGGMGMGGGGGGGMSGGPAEGQADFYFTHDTPGVRGDANADFLSQADDPPGAGLSLYPATWSGTGTVSCNYSFVPTTDAPNEVSRLFIPHPGYADGDCANGVNRWMVFDTGYDLDQDGNCETPYTGHPDSIGNCDGSGDAQELDGEYALTRMHFFDAFLPVDEVNAAGGAVVEPRFQILLLTRDASGAITSIGSQDRAYNIEYVNLAVVTLDPDDPDVRTIAPADGGRANICEVFWKKRSKTCKPILQSPGGDPVELMLPFEVTIDRSP